MVRNDNKYIVLELFKKDINKLSANFDYFVRK